MNITWKHTEKDFSWPLNINDKILIYCERTCGWQLQVAELMVNGGKDESGQSITIIPHSGFAVLQVCLSYFESHAKHEDGFAQDGHSKRFFRKGVRTVFQDLAKWSPATVDPFLDRLYETARCGLYHASKTLDGIILTGSINSTLAYNNTRKLIALNPHRLPKDLQHHANKYVEKLRDPLQIILRTNFEKRFNYDYNITASSTFQTLAGGKTEDSGSMF